MINTQSDIILAVNMHSDLSKLVLKYLLLYRKYTQGYNGVNIPKGDFFIQFPPQNNPSALVVNILCKDIYSTSYEVANHDTGSRWGYWDDDEPWTHTVHDTHTKYNSNTIHIPWSLILDKDMENRAIALNLKISKEAQEKKRLEEIADLEKRLESLKIYKE